MSEDEILLDEDVYEGRTFGWRWFAFLPGPDLMVPPIIPYRKSAESVKSYAPEDDTVDEWRRALGQYFYTYDLFDWSTAHAQPTLKPACLNGFHVFRDYKHAVRRYTAPTIASCRAGFRIPWAMEGWPVEWQQFLVGDWVKSHDINGVPVLGFVELSGTIVEHDDGYRAEKLRLIKLYSPASKAERQALSERIGWLETLPAVRRHRNIKNPLTDNLRKLEA